ncbi:UNVERIFIED_CONTAM: ABC transporter substrate-binding protein [Streptococcus canis]|uniref:tryptophan ABC transporter substrate-binding protein n=1 Tax=Streptococcus canis TaxID=1329 RepID=UPI001144797C|nr:tryptophan ABC transporter substrate-binding protein [Streptococcus canis]MDV6001954.1 ABC transporter substrate-binding protein [Streptococcus canis]MDV6023237.1 ABC transporter substrate-binding protein [Streptococcus canis]
MKNKSLIVTLIILMVMVIGSLLVKGMAKEKGDLASQKNIKIGILQLVTHEALDNIERGIEDQLRKQTPKGKHVTIKLMNAEGDQSKIQAMSRQLTQSGNDIVIGIATPAAQGLAAATKDIPVVMSAISDPVGAKLVKHLERPEGNVTGLSNKVPVKQTIDLMRELTPEAKRIGVLYASNEDNSLSQVKSFSQLAQKKGYQVIPYAVPSTNEVPTTMSIMLSKVDAIFIPQDNTIASAFSSVITASKAAKVPVYSSVDTMVKEGSLASISQSQYQLGVETANQVLRLIKGKAVADISVKVIDHGKPLINKKVAEELGIPMSQHLLDTASFVE